MQNRIGIGYDIHRLVEGRKLFLGGVEIPYIKGLLGHSDGDVLLHAICDALLGAVAQGDIGAHFPDTDPRYHGVSSSELLKNVTDLVKAKDFKIDNIDTVIIAQEPVLTPFKKQIQKVLIPCLISYAIGTLLTAALVGMIPNALSNSNPTLIMLTVLIGIIMFFLLEKTVIWHHCHDEECKLQSAAGPILLIGDTIHNFMDGIVIAASFLISINIGIIVSLSVITHEIPQEIGDFAILLNSGYSKKKAFLLNTLSSSSTLPAALISYYLLDAISSIIPFFLAISAASFIYIALTDLTPTLHHKVEFIHSFRQVLLIIAGVFTIIIILSFKP